MSAYDPKRPSALPQPVDRFSLTTPQNKFIKIGAKVVRHNRATSDREWSSKEFGL